MIRRLVACALCLAAGCTLLVPDEPTNVGCTEEGAIGPPVCPSGTFCHDGACLDGPPRLGDPCGADGVCAVGDQCFDPSMVGLAGQELCSHPCCSSADCGVGTGLVCAVLGPGKMCLPGDLLGRVELGTLFAGERCDKSSECRSGRCDGDQRYCVDACCSDAECGSFDTTCRADGDRGGWMCEPTELNARSGYLAPCKEPAACASGLCAMWPDGVGRCAEPCCSSDECGDGKIGTAIAHILCVPVAQGDAIVNACAAISTGDALRGVGEPCDEPGQCRGGRCIEAGPAGAKVCSDVCCMDASCGAPHLFACAPVDPASPAPAAPDRRMLELQCVPR